MKVFWNKMDNYERKKYTDEKLTIILIYSVHRK